MAEQPSWVWVLGDCAKVDFVLPGAALMALHQRGRQRQVNYLVRHRFARRRGGRLVITNAGLAELKARNVPVYR